VTVPKNEHKKTQALSQKVVSSKVLSKLHGNSTTLAEEDDLECKLADHYDQGPNQCRTQKKASMKSKGKESSK
jgi:hypothetical protein